MRKMRDNKEQTPLDIALKIQYFSEILPTARNKVLVQVSGLIQDLYLSESESNQFLGDLFEGFLNRSVHQTEGRFFTPMPLTNFMIASLPKLSSDLKVLDFACGAGHFLTEMGAYNPSAILTQRFDISRDGDLICYPRLTNSPRFLVSLKLLRKSVRLLE
ncbi:N-6 DNA methylase [Helicobacter suis]|uniref:N-6 DNA methylase n=1 Tax=Helicobacter suis TaxID=104628 RepID=UPI001F07F29B|nr:N-6 DNA methylase [Helicobacter suis]